MAFEKGHKGYKPKGAVHEKTKQWEALAETITTTHTERFNQCLAKMDDEEFVKAYLMTLEYFKPKLARTEIKGDVEVSGIKQLIIEPASKKDKG